MATAVPISGRHQILILFLGGVVICAAFIAYYSRSFGRETQSKRVLWSSVQRSSGPRSAGVDQDKLGPSSARVDQEKLKEAKISHEESNITTKRIKDSMNGRPPVHERTEVFHPNVTSQKKQAFVSNQNRKAGRRQAVVGVKKYAVPPVLHFVWLAKIPRQFMFTDMACVMRVDKLQNPDRIVFHYSHHPPQGFWWDELQRKLNNSEKIQVTKAKIENILPEKYLDNLQLVSEMVRIAALLESGGIYLDLDIILINKLDPLRAHSVTLSKEKNPSQLNLNVILAEKNATFLNLLRRKVLQQLSPNDSEVSRDLNVGGAAYKLWRENPDFLHVEMGTLTTPDPSEKRFLYGSPGMFLSHWRQLYAVHLMLDGKENAVYNPEYIKDLKTLGGAMLRLAYYGSADEFDPFLPHNLYREELERRQ